MLINRVNLDWQERLVCIDWAQEASLHLLAASNKLARRKKECLQSRKIRFFRRSLGLSCSGSDNLLFSYLLNSLALKHSSLSSPAETTYERVARIPAASQQSQTNFSPNDYEEWEQLPVEDQGGWESVGQGSSESSHSKPADSRIYL